MVNKNRRSKVKEVEVLLKVLESQRATMYSLGVAEKALENLLEDLYTKGDNIGFKTKREDNEL